MAQLDVRTCPKYRLTSLSVHPRPSLFPTILPSMPAAGSFLSAEPLRAEYLTPHVSMPLSLAKSPTSCMPLWHAELKISLVC